MRQYPFVAQASLAFVVILVARAGVMRLSRQAPILSRPPLTATARIRSGTMQLCGWKHLEAADAALSFNEGQHYPGVQGSIPPVPFPAHIQILICV